MNERMLETYIYARKRFLKPGGKMFPQLGRIHVAAFSDEVLYGELVSKAAFWLQVNSASMAFHTLSSSWYQYFSNVVDCLSPRAPSGCR